MNLNEIQARLSEIKQAGYIKTKRKGPTGIGYTLEELLGIDENNIASPDMGEIEIKAQREDSNSLITLFTFNKLAWKLPPLDAINSYGSKDKNGRLGLYYTMGRVSNSAGLRLHITEVSVSIRHDDGTIVAEWMLSKLKERFMEKVKTILLIKASVEFRDGIEYFRFNRARLLTGGTTEEILKSLFESEKLLIDLRLHSKTTSARNHGTGFRVYEKNLEHLYKKIEEIPF